MASEKLHRNTLKGLLEFIDGNLSKYNLLIRLWYISYMIHNYDFHLHFSILFHIVSQKIQVDNCIWICWLSQCKFRCSDKGCFYTR